MAASKSLILQLIWQTFIYNDCICFSPKNSGTLKGQVVWVTGASTGIGAACAVEAASHGAKVLIYQPLLLKVLPKVGPLYIGK